MAAVEEQKDLKSSLSVPLWIGCWISLSFSIIIVNKHVLTVSNFSSPFALALWHMLIASSTSRMAIGLLGLPDPIKEYTSSSKDTRLRNKTALAGCLFAGALVCGNAALHLMSVPAVQMLKVANPAATYAISIVMGTEKLQLLQSTKVLLVCTGVAIASFGDVELSLWGIVAQVGSTAMDTLRCCFLQQVMQQSNLKVSPLVTLAHVAPYSAIALILPMAAIEGPRLVRDYGEWAHGIPMLLLSGLLAAVLNFAVFKVIGLTSALTTSLCGILKDWACILVAMHVFGTAVSKMQWVGYSIAICGLLWYQSGRWKAQAQPSRSDDTSCKQAPKPLLADQHKAEEV
eukprot:GHUV01017065.1.p1 GENE.GHUV01017065.1~~GHUV01017065.1.p1  ORF type:complete len:344 (+),score=80.49 GHUV01017065.1:861-1892(+)